MRTEPASSNNIGYPLRKQEPQRSRHQTQRIDNAQNLRRNPNVAAKKPQAGRLSDVVTPKERDFIQRLFSGRGMFRSYHVASTPIDTDVRLGSRIDVKV